jgi:hypothetical protein
MIKTVIFLPERDNDGHLFGPALWAEVEDRLSAVFGGFTRQDGYKGVWPSESGVVYRDDNVAFTVAMTVRQLPAWVAFAEWALVAFAQEAVYVEVAGSPEILKAVGGS